MKLINCKYTVSTGGWDPTTHPEVDTLECLWDYGFYSNTFQVFSSLIVLLRHGLTPRRISYEHGFKHFKRNPQEDIYPLFHQIKSEGIALPLFEDLYIPDTNRTKGEFGKYPFTKYAQIMHAYFAPSALVEHAKLLLAQKYQVNSEETIAVLYRGTDKGTEIALASPERYLEVAQTLLTQNPGFRVLIQSDQTQVVDLFKRELGNACFSFDEIPTTSNQTVLWRLIEANQNMDPTQNAQWFDAALRTVAACKYLVNHTGNVGMFALLYRGHAQGVFQFDEYGQLT